jgi:23S rRNA (cytosine1962-C5)-methyltransferase
MNSNETIVTKGWADYELLDSGDSEKLERFGAVLVRRPDPQALWRKRLPGGKWNEANAHFDKQWKGRKNIPESWNIEAEGLRFMLKLSAFKHLGIFPEQKENWKWIEEKIKGAGRPISLINLFGYTGGATMAALKANANVVHVDGSKTAITWAKENITISNLADKPVRFILDDALTFVRREIKRGHSYDALIMDPPAFGHGPNGEVWKIEKNFLEIVDLLPSLLSPNAIFILVNGYASGYSQEAYRNALLPFVSQRGGELKTGELAIAESISERLLPAGVFARWSN